MEFLKISARQYRQMIEGKKENKYHAIKTESDGIEFDSKFEAEKWQELKILEKSGIIKDLQRQVRFILLDGYTNNKGEKIRPISYIADFTYIDVKKKQKIAMDTKGLETEVFRIKKKLFEHKFPEYLFLVIKK